MGALDPTAGGQLIVVLIVQIEAVLLYELRRLLKNDLYIWRIG